LQALSLSFAGSRYFGLLLTGQTIASINNGLIWGAPGLLSEVWFPASERATATALGAAVSPQLGILVAFALGPVLVGRSDTNEVCGNESYYPSRDTTEFSVWSQTISTQMFYYLLGQAVLSLVILVLTLAAFPSAPPTPPSRSRQMAETTMQVESFGSTLAKFLKNKHYMFFLVAAGINVASSLATVSLINELIHPYFKVTIILDLCVVRSLGVRYFHLCVHGYIPDWAIFHNVTILYYCDYRIT